MPKAYFHLILYQYQAASFGLVDRSVDGEHSDYASMIQTLNRFILEEFATEGNAGPDNPRLLDQPHLRPGAPPITQLLGIDAKTVTACTNCGFSRDKDIMSHAVDMVYPRKVCSLYQIHQQQLGVNSEFRQPGRAEPAIGLDFASILRSSLDRDIIYKSTCQNCKHLSNHRSARTLSRQHMPPILAINAGVNTDEHFKFWQDPASSSARGFLTSSVTLPMRSEESAGVQGREAPSEPVVYDLRVSTFVPDHALRY